MEPPYMVVTTRMDVHIYEAMRSFAFASRVTNRSVIEQALIDYLDKHTTKGVVSQAA